MDGTEGGLPDDAARDPRALNAEEALLDMVAMDAREGVTDFRPAAVGVVAPPRANLAESALELVL